MKSSLVVFQARFLFYVIGISYHIKTLREDCRGAEGVDIALQSRLAQEFASELFVLSNEN